MKVGKIQFNNKSADLTLNNKSGISFNGLHVTPETLKETHFTERELLSDPYIKNAADKFEVLCTAGKKKYILKDFAVPASAILKLIRNSFGIGILAGISSALLPEAIISSFAMPNLPLAVSHIGIGMLAGSLYGFINSLSQYYKKVPELNIQIGEKIDINEKNIDNAKLKGHTSDIELSMRKVGIDGNIKVGPYDGAVGSACCNISIKEENDFNEVLSYFDTDDLFDAKNYLRLLKKLKEKCPNDKRIFEYKIDKMGNTMLTAFFDVPLTINNEKSYSEILDILSKEPKLDFNQKGYKGISILEKIMIAENEKALDFAKRHTMFNYTPELNDIYVNIQDKSFKEKVKSLNFEYKDLTHALLSKSGKALERLMPYIEASELLDRSALQSQIEYTLNELVNDKNFELYLAKNFPQLFYDTKDGKIWRNAKTHKGGNNES